jgi:hypothetical protein
MKNSIRIGDKVMGIMGVAGGYAGTVTAIKRDGRHTVVFFVDDDGATYETLDSNITKNVPEKGKFPRKNPVRGQKESPLYVKYLSLKKDEEPFMMQGTKYEYVWAEYPGGIKDIGVYSYANDLVYSYDSFRQMMNLPNPLKRRKGESIRDFTSRCMSEEKESFPKTKQRIAVCLSKSRKRNPLESGASISDDEDINARASNMG